MLNCLVNLDPDTVTHYMATAAGITVYRPREIDAAFAADLNSRHPMVGRYLFSEALSKLDPKAFGYLEDAFCTEHYVALVEDPLDSPEWGAPEESGDYIKREDFDALVKSTSIWLVKDARSDSIDLVRATEKPAGDAENIETALDA